MPLTNVVGIWALLPIILGSHHLLASLCTALCGVLVMVGSAPVASKPLRILLGVTLISLYCLALQAISYKAFSALTGVLPLWLLASFNPASTLLQACKAALMLLIAALGLGLIREVLGQAQLFSDAYSWFGIHSNAWQMPWPALPLLTLAPTVLVIWGLAIALLRRFKGDL